MNLSLTQLIRPSLFLAAIFVFAGYPVHAQDIEAKITLIAPARVRIEGKFLDPKFATNNWTFLQRYADVENLGKRIDKLLLFDKDGIEVAVKKFAPGIYEASGDAMSWQYEVSVEPPDEPTAAAHVSWLAEDGGLLMTEDLLPRVDKNESLHLSARISLDLPPGWAVNSPDLKTEDLYFSPDISRSVFQVGRNWRESNLVITGHSLRFFIRGEWQFTDQEAIGIAGDILSEHFKTFGEMPAEKMSVILSPFPRPVEPGRWRAETRGSTVVLLSSQMPFKSQGLNRLHEQLRHEIFHFWVPNKLALTGNYDWFFEGFTLYQALKTGKKVNRIHFSDVLDTLGRAYTLNESSDRGLSLIEASKKRWDGNFGFVNSRGMMVAFMCDAAILSSSKGKRSLTDLFQKVYRLHNSSKPLQDGNAAILEIIKSYPELNEIRARYIEGREKLALTPVLLQTGLETEVKAGLTTFRIRQKLTGRQKQLLLRLGLNPLYEFPENTK